MKETWLNFCISFVCGVPGSGKSYLLAQDVVARLLSGFQGKIFTNLPLEVKTIAAYVAGSLKCDIEDVESRIVLLSREQLSAWQDGQGGPWDLASDAQGNDFILDECHLFCKRSGQSHKVRNERWEKWLGEVRHEGWARLVFVTQDESKVGKPISEHAELRFELTNSARRRDPILKIQLVYWYELIASFTREFRSSIAVTEYRKIRGKLVEQHTERVPLDPAGFEFYRSYEATGGGAGGGSGAQAQLREFQKRPVLMPEYRSLENPDGSTRRAWVAPTWAWVVRSNWWRFALAAFVVCSLGYLVAGGSRTLLTAFISKVSGRAVATSAEKSGKSSAAVPSTLVRGANGPGNMVYAPDALPVSAAVAPDPAKVSASLAKLESADREVLTGAMRYYSEAWRAAEGGRAAAARAAAKQMKLHEVVAVTKDTAWFTRPPCSCKVGKIMDEGPYRGKMVRLINVDEGFVDLDGGVRLYVGRGLQESPAGVASGGSGPSLGNASGAISGALQSMGPGAGERSLLKGGTTNNDQRPGDAAGGPVPVPGGGIGPLNSDGGGVRNTPAVDGDTRPAGERDNESPGPTPAGEP